MRKNAANLAALAAIGPRKRKRPDEVAGCTAVLLYTFFL